MKFMYFSIKYRNSDILLKKNFIYNRLFCCNHTCYRVNMVYVTSASRYKPSAPLITCLILMLFFLFWNVKKPVKVDMVNEKMAMISAHFVMKNAIILL